ncbi:SRPBCC domain-containing protein [Betaproteobacteria bacterium LSUCC0117]|jgi:uncharacterized protein YndB with AHSA1/START domain|nr:SRPBCC domain-containing protein [Betaproteobacteria bacterium LSUCC0117]MDX1330282.1 SRPBCC domain-containing protein [Burkholderiaceae bacterium]
MQSTDRPDLDLELTVDVPLTPEQLFAGWTNPQMLPKWFCPRPWQVVECEIDPRPGGVFANVMQSPEGVRLPRNEGCFLLVEPPHRIIWTGVLSRGFRPQAQKELDFGFVCDLSFTALQTGGSRFNALVMHSDAEGKAKHEQMGFDQGWRIALSQLVELYG